MHAARIGGGAAAAADAGGRGKPALRPVRSDLDDMAALFQGQPRPEFDQDLAFFNQMTAARPNALALDEARLLQNLRAVQQRNGIPPDDKLQCIEEMIPAGPGGQRPGRFPNYSVEMETGTGKTYVYLRTALELYRRYGLSKFIIVVPSVAIREGVLKSLKITESHLIQLRVCTKKPDRNSAISIFRLMPMTRKISVLTAARAKIGSCASAT